MSADGGRPSPAECCKFVSAQIRALGYPAYADRIEELIAQLSETRQMDAGETGNRTVPLDRELASTHWDDCWRKHHGCAVAKIERLSAVTEIKSADPMAEPLNHRRLKNGESCYRCGKVVTAWLSHICDERKTAPAEVDAPKPSTDYRDAERWRYARDHLFIGYIADDVAESWDDEAIDAAIRSHRGPHGE